MKMNMERMNIPTNRKFHSKSSSGYERTIWYDQNDNIVKFLDNDSNDLETLYDIETNKIIHCIDFTNKYEFYNYFDKYHNQIGYENNNGTREGIMFDTLDKLENYYKEKDIDKELKCAIEFLINAITHEELNSIPNKIKKYDKSIKIIYKNKMNYISFEFYKDKFICETNIKNIDNRTEPILNDSNVYTIDIWIINSLIDQFYKEVNIA